MNFNIKSNSNGFGTLSAIILFLLIESVCVGIVASVLYANKSLAKSKLESEEKLKMEKMIYTISKELSLDGSPESQSPFDSIWNYHGKTSDGINISLEDLSGKLNINFVSDRMLQKVLSCMNGLSDGDISMIINSRKSQNRLVYSDEKLLELLGTNNVSYFTYFGTANLNTVEEEPFKLIVSSLCSGVTADSLWNKTLALRKNDQQIMTETEFKLLLGVYYSDLKNILTINAPINVNFADEKILKSILTTGQTENLIRLRSQKEITAEDLTNICRGYNSDLSKSELGTRTWFWKINLCGIYVRCSAIVSQNKKSQTSIEEINWEYL